MSDSALHPLDRAIALEPLAAHRYQGQTNPAYQNMVGPYGGIIAAILLNGVLEHPDRLGEPVALTVHFAAPIADGRFELQARPMRTNRNTQHWLVELSQDDGIAAYATAITANRRDTWGTTDAEFPAVPPATDVPLAELPPLRWTGCYEMRFVEGAMGEPAAGPHPSRTRVWLRDKPARTLDFAALASLCDAFFPRIFLRRPGRVPVGTVTLTTYFHVTGAQLAAIGTEPVLGEARGSVPAQRAAGSDTR
jgi:hypothetical protein